MKLRKTMIAISVCFTLAVPFVAATADSDDEKKVVKAPLPMFVPTNLGSPTTRLGGATRSADDDGVPHTEALVPENAGHTLKSQPVLYWYLPKKTEYQIDFKLIGVDPINPILHTTLKNVNEAGVQKIALKDLDIELEHGVSYQWFVMVVPDPTDRMSDRMVGGGIEMVKASPELQAKLDENPTDTFALAQAGIWYDALDAISQQIAATPGDATLTQQRAALFDQAGLESVN
jgi:hypothetical protein